MAGLKPWLTWTLVCLRKIRHSKWYLSSFRSFRISPWMSSSLLYREKRQLPLRFFTGGGYLVLKFDTLPVNSERASHHPPRNYKPRTASAVYSRTYDRFFPLSTAYFVSKYRNRRKVRRTKLESTIHKRCCLPSSWSASFVRNGNNVTLKFPCACLRFDDRA